MNNTEPNFELFFENYKIAKLSKDDIPEIQTLFEASADYFKLILNMKVQPDEAESLFRQLPKGKKLEDKFDFGIYQENALVGVIDIIKDYPEEKTWFIGLLLFHPNYRGKGLGSKIFTTISKKRKEIEVYKIRISVAEQNVNALQFWQNLGFKENGKGFKGISNIIYFDYIL